MNDSYNFDLNNHVDGALLSYENERRRSSVGRGEISKA